MLRLVVLRFDVLGHGRVSLGRHGAVDVRVERPRRLEEEGRCCIDVHGLVFSISFLDKFPWFALVCFGLLWFGLPSFIACIDFLASRHRFASAAFCTYLGIGAAGGVGRTPA